MIKLCSSLVSFSNLKEVFINVLFAQNLNFFNGVVYTEDAVGEKKRNFFIAASFIKSHLKPCYKSRLPTAYSWRTNFAPACLFSHQNIFSILLIRYWCQYLLLCLELLVRPLSLYVYEHIQIFKKTKKKTLKVRRHIRRRLSNNQDIFKTHPDILRTQLHVLAWYKNSPCHGNFHQLNAYKQFVSFTEDILPCFYAS